MRFLKSLIITLLVLFSFNILAELACSQNGTVVFFVNGYDLNDKDKVIANAERQELLFLDKNELDLDSEGNVKFSYIFLDRFSYLRKPFTEAEKNSPVLQQAS